LLAVDGTSTVTFDSRNHRQKRKIYVHYKGHCGWRWTIVVSMTGRILYISRMRPGKITDEEVMELDKILSKINDAYPRSDVEIELSAGDGSSGEDALLRELVLLADKGYKRVVVPKDCHVRLVCTASGEKELVTEGTSPKGATFSNRIAPLRSVVERVFGMLKSRHGLLANVPHSLWNADVTHMDNLLYVACCALNFEKRIF